MKQTTATYVTELDEKLAGALARCAEKAWWHAHFHLARITLVCVDIKARVTAGHKTARRAADHDNHAAVLIRKAMSDGLTEADRDDLMTALEHIDQSARHDERMVADLNLTPTTH